MITIEDVLHKFGYKIDHEIGYGAFSHCYLVKSYKYNDTYFVAKVMNKNESESNHSERCYFNEISVLQHHNHQNIVSIYDHFHFGNYYVILMEYCSGGCAESYLRKNGPFDNKKMKIFAMSLLLALEFLHTHSVAHHDIKPSNFLFDMHHRIKITDFGLSREYYADHKSSYYGGTLDYMSPELFQRKEYNPFKVDIWALGVSLYKMSTGVSPFKGNSKEDTKSRIMNNLYVKLPSRVDQTMANLIYACLIPDPASRPTASQALDILKRDHLPFLNTKAKLVLSQPLPCISGLQPLRCISLIKNQPKIIANKRKRSHIF